ALELSRKLVNFLLKPTMWGSVDGPTMAVANERGLWSGHFHAHTMGVIGLMDYALAANDNSVKEFVANFYNYSKNFGISRIGFFSNSDIGPIDAALKRQPNGVVDEGCAVADMTWLAVKLSEAGVDDYWDDVDQYVRNHLVEHQLLRRDLLGQIIAESPAHMLVPSYQTDKKVLDRNIGCFVSTTDPTMGYAWWIMCCNANCPRALHTA